MGSSYGYSAPERFLIFHGKLCKIYLIDWCQDILCKFCTVYILLVTILLLLSAKYDFCVNQFQSVLYNLTNDININSL